MITSTGNGGDDDWSCPTIIRIGGRGRYCIERAEGWVGGTGCEAEVSDGVVEAEAVAEGSKGVEGIAEGNARVAVSFFEAGGVEDEGEEEDREIKEGDPKEASSICVGPIPLKFPGGVQ